MEPSDVNVRRPGSARDLERRSTPVLVKGYHHEQRGIQNPTTLFVDPRMEPSDESLFALSRKVGLTWATFFGYILPPLACQYAMGVLVQLNGTRFYRLAFLPVTVWLTWRGAFVDLSGGDSKQAQANTMIITHMCSVAMRVTVWAVAREPFRRQSPSKKSGESHSKSVYTALWNAWDLLVNTRGIGWNWSRGLVLPKPIIETDSRLIFVLLSAGRLAINALGFDTCLQMIHIISPETFGSPNGGSLFDHTLPPLLELARAVLVSFFTVWLAYFAIQWPYQIMAIVWVVLFQQHPSQWPPLFNSPWLSTSLSELWGRRWHQLMRELLVTLGMRPFGYLFGPLGGLMGAFLVSGIFHDMELRSIGRGGNSISLIGFWVMCGVGVVLERVWKKTTGRSVGGILGWIWTFGWLALWGVPVVDEWAKSGRLGTLSLPGDLAPSLPLVTFIRRWIEL